MNIPAKGSKKLLNAWAFYDWANSVVSVNHNLVNISNILWCIDYCKRFSNGEKISDTVTFLGCDFNNDSLISYVTAIKFFSGILYVSYTFRNFRLCR